MKIAIIGAGLSGAHMYKLLKRNSHTINVFEKSRGAGGRCSTRYSNESFINHGTPHFQSTDEEFTAFSDQNVAKNILTKKENHYFPTKGLNKLCSSLLDTLDLRRSTKIVQAKRIHQKWQLKDDKDNYYDNFDLLILSIPTPQIIELNIELPHEIKKPLEKITYDSIASLLLFNKSLDFKLPQILNAHSDFKVLYSPIGKNYVIHLNSKETNEQGFCDRNEVLIYMQKKIHSTLNIDLDKHFLIQAHLWKYAMPANSLELNHIYDKNLFLGICGDYFRGNNLQSTYLSSLSLYQDIMDNS